MAENAPWGSGAQRHRARGGAAECDGRVAGQAMGNGADAAGR